MGLAASDGPLPALPDPLGPFANATLVSDTSPPGRSSWRERRLPRPDSRDSRWITSLNRVRRSSNLPKPVELQSPEICGRPTSPLPTVWAAISSIRSSDFLAREPQPFLDLDPRLEVAQRDVELLHRVERHVRAHVAVAVAVRAGRADEGLVRRRLLHLVDDVRLGGDDQQSSDGDFSAYSRMPEVEPT